MNPRRVAKSLAAALLAVGALAAAVAPAVGATQRRRRRSDAPHRHRLGLR